jgi:Icc-related predicted phosphoesterase
MKIKLVSDLHLEFSDIMIPNDQNYDVLILAGDIMIATDLHDHPEPNNTADQAAIANATGLGRRQMAAQRFRDFLKRCSFQFPHVIYVAGNHEFYNGKWTQSLTTLSNECAKFPNVYFLEAGCKKINDVTFIGGTLWTDMNKGDPLTLHAVRDMMNDFRVIKKDLEGYTNLKPADTVVRHRHMLGYIKTVVAERPDEKFVVVGHMSPSRLSTHPRYADDTIMNGAYSSSLDDFIIDHPQIQLWTHGHTHEDFDYMVGSTRIVCNPRGYINYEPRADSWTPKLVEV